LCADRRAACTGERVRTRWLGLAPALLILSIAGCSSPTAPDSPSTATAPAPAPSLSGMASAIVDLTNAERRNGGLVELRAHTRLMQAAQLQADQVASLRRLEHVLPEATYPAPADRLAAAGYVWRAYGENLASGQRGASEAVSGWMASPGHRANIMNGTFTEIGVGFATDSTGRPYYAQVFGTPR
jgi:uncharacterized protein YkwD